MLAPGGHQGHLKPPFSFLISMARLLPHSTVTRASEYLTSTGHPEGKRRKDLKTNHKNCSPLTGTVRGWLGAQKIVASLPRGLRRLWKGICLRTLLQPSLSSHFFSCSLVLWERKKKPGEPRNFSIERTWQKQFAYYGQSLIKEDSNIPLPKFHQLKDSQQLLL